MLNKKIAEMFDEIADMLELDAQDRVFEIRAYRKAALNIGSIQEDVSDILKKDGVIGLKKIPGIGEGLAAKIKEYVETGRMKKYDELKKKYPIDFQSLTTVQGLGAKKAFKLYKALGVKNLDDLKKAIVGHKIAGLEGFGKKSEEELLKGLGFLESGKGRILLGIALPAAQAMARKISESGLAQKVVVAGSIRRMRETIGDIDILVISNEPKRVMDFVSKLKEVSSVMSRGDTKATYWLAIGTSCDVRIVEAESFGSALQYFTGSKDHGVKVRQLALKKGLSLSEYGLFDRHKKNVASATEEEVYKKIGLQYVEPEMRENRGEIELALKNKLPKPISYDDLLGDLHVHTNHTDGNDTLEDMAIAAQRLGREYVGITDHSKSEYQARGMDDAKFRKYFTEIDRLNKKLDGKITVLKSGEVDILKDGSLDLSKRTLDEMDYVLATVHLNRNMDKAAMTKRVIDAFETGYVDIWAHPTGRLINARAPMQMDLDRVFQAAKDNNVVMEIDSYPDRLDLNDENARRAKEFGLKFSIDTDAHRTSELSFLRYGIGTARRAWIEEKDVINALGVKDLLKLFEK